MPFIKLKDFSVQHLAIATILLVGISSVGSIWTAEYIFRSTILTTIKSNITNIINVAVQEANHKTRDRAIQFANRTQNYSGLRDALSEFLKDRKNTSEVIKQLNTPFIKGYVDVYYIELIKLRVYDTNYRPLIESSHGLELPHGLPQFIEQRAANRKGTERLKALGGLWSADGQPLYSILVPIGGLRVKGYLEAVFNPAFNIGAIDQITQIPVIITSSSNELLYRSDSPNLRSADRLPIKQSIIGDDGSTIFQIQSFEDISEVYEELYAAQTVLGGGLLLANILIVLLAVWVLYRFLLSPLLNITSNIDRMSDRNARVHIQPTGLREFRHLAVAFNTMCDTVRSHTKRLEVLSSTDGLTNIANRRAFDDALEREWLYCAREQVPISLLYIDIDFFKNYNDHYGHQQGDECLISIAQLIEYAARRPSDLAARYGGEEFVILLSNTDREGAKEIARVLMDEINKSAYAHAESGVADHITLSIGISTLTPSDKISQDHLITLADKALYRAKEEGRNRVCIA